MASGDGTAVSVPGRPRATYRLQFGKDFRFDDARRIVPYLAALGVSHLYASPLLKARPGSTHGYDIVDHNRLNPEIGKPAEFDALVDELQRHGMGLVLDFVPNHMGVGPDNRWWVDVLEWGRESPYAGFFDIDWDPAEPTLAGKVLLPVLGDHYGAVLDRGELQLRLHAERGSLAVAYFESPFPVALRDYPPLLEAAAERSAAAARVLEPLADELRASLRGGRGKSAVLARREQVADLKRRIAERLQGDPAARRALGEVIGALNGEPGRPASFDALHRLLERQAWRLAFWRVAAHEINYRRFFDIDDLAGLRMEQPELFEASHGLVRRLFAEGRLQGLRLDHVDGLRDPKAYFEQLQALAASAGAPRPLYLLVEKILAPHEGLRRDWAVDGTTGYEFMSAVSGLFVDPAGERSLTQHYERIAGRSFDFEEMSVEAKLQVVHESLASELNVLANLFTRLAKQNRATRDFTRTGLREALAGVVAHFPVYRTYITGKGAGPEDRRDLEWAIGKARRAARVPDTSSYDFIRDVLTLDLRQPGGGYRRRDVLDAALKFQQYTGPVMAKAMEDTTFYRYVRLASLNEVGSEPGRFGIRPAAFHEANRLRLRDYPLSMLATATHDHKRGEDVRARLNVLSEVPAEWVRRVRRWQQMNARKRRELDGRPAPGRNDEYLLYQTVVGAWPYEIESPQFEGLQPFSERIGAYMLKAAREAKLRTSWAARNEAYEQALADFVARTLDPRQSRPYLEDLRGFVGQIAAAGAVNGLAQALLKLVSPGVPDIYQGCESWDFSLVDPDNRRPVDYAGRRAALAASGAMSPAELLAGWRDGRVKLHVIARALNVRRRLPELFAAGDYQPLEASGLHAERVVAMLRKHGGEACIGVVPRLAWPLLGDREEPLPRGWGDTRLAVPPEPAGAGTWFDVLSGAEVFVPPDGRLDVARLLGGFPVALLVNAPDAAQPG